jgi:hypothetical protein
MKKKLLYDGPIPEWSMEYAENIRTTSLMPGDKEMLFSFLRGINPEKKYDLVFSYDFTAGKYFMKNPPFGLSCNCYDCKIHGLY